MGASGVKECQEEKAARRFTFTRHWTGPIAAHEILSSTISDRGRAKAEECPLAANEDPAIAQGR
jgi:hypothetical protein